MKETGGMKHDFNHIYLIFNALPEDSNAYNTGVCLKNHNVIVLHNKFIARLSITFFCDPYFKAVICIKIKDQTLLP